MSKRSKKLKRGNYKLHQREVHNHASQPVSKTSVETQLEDVAKKGVMLGAFACFSIMMLFGVIWFTAYGDSESMTVSTKLETTTTEEAMLAEDPELESELVPVAGGVYVSCKAETTVGGWLISENGGWNHPTEGLLDEKYYIPTERESEFIKYWNGVVKKMNSMTRYTLTHKIIQEGKPNGTGSNPFFITEQSLRATLDRSELTTKSCISSLSDPTICTNQSDFDKKTTTVETHPRRNSCTYNTYVTLPDGTIEDSNSSYDPNYGREEMAYRKYNPLKILGIGDDEFISWVVGIDTDPNKREGNDAYGEGLEVVYVQRARNVGDRSYFKVYVQNGVIYKIDESGSGILQSIYTYKMR